MVNDRSQSAQIKKNNRAEEWLKNAVKDKHVRLIPFSEISKVKYNVAKGGSGTIHLGAWRNMHVAIKEQHNTNDLIKELKMHKQVHDSNYIVKFFGITKHPLTHDTCIVMQFAENGCLQDYLETQNVSITWLTKYRLAWEIASGLDFIHRENIFHTDLHSRNILIDTDGKALITDFGLSKSVNKTIYTTKAGLFGVVPYVAPERMQNPTITYTSKCDIYSLGVILWELSSCVIPFEAQLQDVMLAVNIINGVREKTVPGTAVEYEMLYRRCWDGLPQNRPQMDIVLSELVELLASEQSNPRPAAPRPKSPRPARPLSSDSMVAPSSLFPYDNESTLQPSPENTNHVNRPASPPTLLRSGYRQSFGQGMTPLVPQPVPSVPIRQDRSGVRVSFLGDPLGKDNQVNGQSKTNGVVNSHTKSNQSSNKNNNNGRSGAASEQTKKSPAGHDSPTILDIIPDGAAKIVEDETVKSHAAGKDQAHGAVLSSNDGKRQSSEGKETSTASQPASESAITPASEATGLPLLPPLPVFNPSFSPNTTPKESILPPAPVDPAMGKLPETAALFLSSGLSMQNVVSKLNKASIKNIPTISPPPNGALPPPPGAVAGHSNFPRVISPPSTYRPKTVSPPKMRNQGLRASKTISPPTGPPPAGPPPSAPRTTPSPSLGPIPKPPSGPPPMSRAPTPSDNASMAGAGTSRNPAALVDYTPMTTYTGKPKSPVTGDPEQPASPNSTLSDTTRPTPARNIPMGFPVVTPLNPPHWNVKPSPSSVSSVAATATEKETSGTVSESTPSGSPTGSPSSTNSTPPSSAGSTPTSNRRDFRPISFLTQPKHSSLIDFSAQAEQHTQQQQQQQDSLQPKKSAAENVYVPNPNNNIIPPSQLHLQHIQNTDLFRPNNRNSRMLGSPSLGPSPSPTLDSRSNNNRIIHSPHLGPSNGRPGSPAFTLPPPSSSSSSARGGTTFPTVEGSIWMREPKVASSLGAGKRTCVEEDFSTLSMRQGSEARENINRAPQQTNPPSSSSATNPAANGTSLSTSPSSAISANSSITTMNTNASASTSTTAAAASSPANAIAPIKPRVQLDNFYSLADPYKDLQHDEPTDFFTAVTQSDIATIERMLKLFPNLIHESNGFWPHPTPILVAARSRYPIETMKTLIQYGAALDRGDHNGTTVLHFVCEQYSDPVEAIQFLTRAGADCNSRDAKKRTPLMVLLQNSHVCSTKVLIDSMRCLFKFGAQTKVMDHQFQRTPLHYAILHSKEPAPVMELLLKKGSEVNARDWRKSTPLHLVLEKMDDEEIVQMLLLYGADPGLKNGNKRNALGVAAENLRVMSAWFLLENDLMSSAPESIKKANELCSKADGPDKSAKPLFKNTLSDWQGKEGKQRRIQLAQDVVLRVQRTPDMKTIDQTQYALEFLDSVGQPIHLNNVHMNNINVIGSGITVAGGSIGAGGVGGLGMGIGIGSGSNVSPTTSSHSHR